MSKWLVTADNHLTNRHSKFKLDNDGVSDFLKAQWEFFDWCAQLLEDDDYDGCLILGDITDHSTLDPLTLTYLHKCLARLFKTGKKIIVLEGNHCITDQGNLFTVVGAASELWHAAEAGEEVQVRFVTQREKIHVNGVDFYCCPYLSDYDAVEEGIAEWNKEVKKADVPSVLLYHFPTVNAVLDNGLPSQKGVNLSKDICDNFTVCLGGDFHKPQRLINTSNAYYVGAPFDLKFGQMGPRVITNLIIDHENDEYELEQIENPFNFPMIYIDEDNVKEVLERDDLSRTIARLREAPSEDLRLLMESHRDRFYSLYLPSLSKVKKDRPEGVQVLGDLSRSRDRDILSSQLEELGADKEMRATALDIFQKIAEKE